MARRLARNQVDHAVARAPSAPGEGAAISLRRNTIAAQIHALLRRDIVAGRLLPRAMLAEQDLAARFGVSRTPIREAMIKLSEEGLVEIFPQYGSFVAPIKLAEVFDAQFARESLECAAVEKAAANIEGAHDKALKALIARQRLLLRAGDHDGFFRADEDLHALILRIAGHASAWHIVENTKAQMDRVRYLAMTIPRKQSFVVAEHAAVVDNLIARDRKGAVEAMRVHLRGIFRTIEILRREKHDYFAQEQGETLAGVPRSVGGNGSSTTVVKRRTRTYAKPNTTNIT
jgi:DNA-binding GntR family transcriptional regulator